jgi:hypothetical protein
MPPGCSAKGATMAPRRTPRPAPGRPRRAGTQAVLSAGAQAGNMTATADPITTNDPGTLGGISAQQRPGVA